jgi:aerobic carbon-monoxide dehydrogenase medium subunit
MALPKFEYLSASHLDEALLWLNQYGEEAKVAGGTTVLLTMLDQRVLLPSCVISLSQLDSLRYVVTDADCLKIGALTSHRAIETSEALQGSPFGIIAQMERDVGSVQLRNRGTIGGNLAYADPFCDPPCVLTALDATIVLRSVSGERSVSIQDFYKDYFETELQPTEVITEIRVPVLPQTARGYYYKFTARQGMDKPYIGVAVVVTPGTGGDGVSIEDISIAIGAVSTGPVRAREAEGVLRGQEVTSELIDAASHVAARGMEPLPDLRCGESYKKRVLPVIVRRAISKALENVGGVDEG